MNSNILKKLFINYCDKNKFDKNVNQIKIIELLSSFYLKKKNILDFILKKKIKLAFYLYGNVGVGKTMVLNFFYNNLEVSKLRIHFNEFMLNFHDYRHKFKNENDSIEKYVKELKKKYRIIYLDEFQVTNIVDAMILGKLFEIIFKENLKIIITSNIKINDLYKDGLQRDQFKPFISLIKEFSIEKELIIDDDYRKSSDNNMQRFFYPLNEKTNFKINKIFREITKNKKKENKIIKVKGRDFVFKNYFNQIARFNFDELCNKNLGAEDYISIAEICNFIIIENIPNFSDDNINQQQRFITLIDILYEKKILLLLSSNLSIQNFNSSIKLKKPFLRTISRIHELTSKKTF